MQRPHLVIAVLLTALSGCTNPVDDEVLTSTGFVTNGFTTTGEGTTGDEGTSTGDGDGDPATTTGDGDGDPTTTTTTGDGDGDPTTTTTGDGDGDPTTTTTGDGDGDPTTTGDPIPACGWDPNNSYYECGFEGADPGGTPIACPDGLVEGEPCANTGLTGEGCCDPDGNLWYCTVDRTALLTPC